MSGNKQQLQAILEAAIFASPEPLSMAKLVQLFPSDEAPEKAEITEALEAIAEHYQDRGVELTKVASGYRFQSRQDYASWLQRLWEKKPPRYTRAMLETLALIIYRQPITRGEIEAVRGVAVSANIIKTLVDREWIKVVGHKEVPGKPALLGTTKYFLDYFNLKSLSQLPPLRELIDIDKLAEQVEHNVQTEALTDESGAEINAESEAEFDSVETAEEAEVTDIEEAAELLANIGEEALHDDEAEVPAEDEVEEVSDVEAVIEAETSIDDEEEAAEPEQ